MSKKDWIWMGHPGHLCVAFECRFRLNTHVNGYIVSTVGEYDMQEDFKRSLLEDVITSDGATESDKAIATNLKTMFGRSFKEGYRGSFGYEELRFGFYYETEVFKAVARAGTCCPYVQTGDVIDEDLYVTDCEAMEGHYRMCEKYDVGGTR